MKRVKKNFLFICKNCGKECITTNHNSYGIYCSNKCQGEYLTNKKYKDWLEGIYSPSINTLRFYLKKLRGNKCENCKISEWQGKEIVLEVEHIDGNYLNNVPSNLKLLCPNCHSQTPTYKAKNKGKGRESRRKLFKKCV